MYITIPYEYQLIHTDLVDYSLEFGHGGTEVGHCLLHSNLQNKEVHITLRVFIGCVGLNSLT